MSDIYILYLVVTYLFAFGRIVGNIPNWREVGAYNWLYILFAPILVPVAIGRDSG